MSNLISSCSHSFCCPAVLGLARLATLLVHGTRGDLFGSRHGTAAPFLLGLLDVFVLTFTLGAFYSLLNLGLG
jgi:hypothetical protein